MIEDVKAVAYYVLLVKHTKELEDQIGPDVLWLKLSSGAWLQDKSVENCLVG